MDPIACLKECIDLFDVFCISEDREDKIALMEKLLEYSCWRAKGGLNPPHVMFYGSCHDGDHWMGWIIDQL